MLQKVEFSKQLTLAFQFTLFTCYFSLQSKSKVHSEYVYILHQRRRSFHFMLNTIPLDTVNIIFSYLSSKELCFIDRTCKDLQVVSRKLPFRRNLPDGSYRRVVVRKTRSSGIIVVQRLNTRPERPRDNIHHHHFR